MSRRGVNTEAALTGVKTPGAVTPRWFALAITVVCLFLAIGPMAHDLYGDDPRSTCVAAGIAAIERFPGVQEVEFRLGNDLLFEAADRAGQSVLLLRDRGGDPEFPFDAFDLYCPEGRVGASENGTDRWLLSPDRLWEAWTERSTKKYPIPSDFNPEAYSPDGMPLTSSRLVVRASGEIGQSRVIAKCCPGTATDPRCIRDHDLDVVAWSRDSRELLCNYRVRAPESCGHHNYVLHADVSSGKVRIIAERHIIQQARERGLPFEPNIDWGVSAAGFADHRTVHVRFAEDPAESHPPVEELHLDVDLNTLPDAQPLPKNEE